MSSTHDLIAGFCTLCQGPIRLFCTRCGYMWKDQTHLKTCPDKEAKAIYYCQCWQREVTWGVKPKRFKPSVTVEDTLFEMPAKVPR